MSDKDLPAFPFGQVSELTGQPINGYFSAGMTLRQYAAINLKVPDSGTDWLDEMITQSLRDSFAEQMLSSVFGATSQSKPSEILLAKAAYAFANAMLEARKA